MLEKKCRGPQNSILSRDVKQDGICLVGIFILIIANFILLSLFLLLTPVANVLIILIRDNNNGRPGGPNSGGSVGH